MPESEEKTCELLRPPARVPDGEWLKSTLWISYEGPGCAEVSSAPKECRSNETPAMLAEIYNWFTEGFDTADLKDAKALLEELTDPR
jgi:hypothetical protein